MRCDVPLNHACRRLRLARGALICCSQGSVWLTLETPCAAGPSPDIVLLAGQRYRVTEPGDYFLTHLGHGDPALCVVEQAARTPRWLRARWSFKLR